MDRQTLAQEITQYLGIAAVRHHGAGGDAP